MELKEKEFQQVRSILHNYSGIYLHEGKQALVRSRLMKRIRKLGLKGFDQYLDIIQKDKSGAEFLSLVDVLTTNKTSFFRESKHFDFIREVVIPEMGARPVKWWFAGCSTGEEPISAAITLLEEQEAGVPGSVRMLATDLSRNVLQVARHGVYSADKLADLPGYILNKYFQKNEEGQYRVVDKVKNLITYGRLNLKERWPLKGPFHLIMCRNVMIYFDQQTQRELIASFYNLLEPGGYLFLGHSESLSGSKEVFKSICPAVYQKR